MKPTTSIILVIASLAFIGLGCPSNPPTQPDDPPPPPPIEVNDCEIPQEVVQQIYDLACKVCRNHMYYPETAVFRSLDESYVAITSKELFMVVSTVVGNDQNNQEVVSGFMATFEIYRDRPMVHSFLSWEWGNRPLFKPNPLK